MKFYIDCKTGRYIESPEPQDQPDYDLHQGNIKPKWKYPYNYSPFTIWGTAGPVKGTEAVYTDRLRQWDRVKYEQLSKKHYTTGHPFQQGYCQADQIQDFLREYYDDPQLKLVRVVQDIDVSNGNPVWVLYYLPGKKL